MPTEANTRSPVQPFWQAKLFAEYHGPVETLTIAALDEVDAAAVVSKFMEYENLHNMGELVRAEVVRVVFANPPAIELGGFRREG
jgi:hypothetical protein